MSSRSRCATCITSTPRAANSPRRSAITATTTHPPMPRSRSSDQSRAKMLAAMASAAMILIASTVTAARTRVSTRAVCVASRARWATDVGSRRRCMVSRMPRLPGLPTLESARLSKVEGDAWHRHDIPIRSTNIVKHRVGQEDEKKLRVLL